MDKSASVYVKYNDHDNEHVVRIQTATGDFALCGCPGKDEAQLVAACVVAVLVTREATMVIDVESTKDGFVDKTAEFKHLSEYHESQDAIKNASTRINEFLKW